MRPTVLLDGINGMTEASATRSRSMLRTRRSASTTVSLSGLPQEEDHRLVVQVLREFLHQ
jgi:hypothetical protein